MRTVLALSLMMLPLAPAFAQDAASRQALSPISGPNDTIPSPICDLVNFGFCPQPPSPPPLLPDPEADAAPPPRAVIEAPRHRRHRVVRRPVVRQEG